MQMQVHIYIPTQLKTLAATETASYTDIDTYIWACPTAICQPGATGEIGIVDGLGWSYPTTGIFDC